MQVQSGYYPAGGVSRGRFNYVFGNDHGKGNLVIIVEKTTAYSEYKLDDGEFLKLYLNLDALDELQNFIGTVVTVMANGILAME